MTAVAGRADHEHPRVAGGAHGVLEVRPGVGARQCQQHDVRAVRDGVADAVGDRRRRGRRARIHHLDRHDPGTPRDARDPDPVVAAGSDDPGEARPVTVVVARVGVAGDHVPAVDVVHVTVPVVVDAVARHLVRVRPQVGDEIPVRHVDPGVDDRDRDRRATGEAPRARRAHDAVVRQLPLLGEARVVGDARRGPGRLCRRGHRSAGEDDHHQRQRRAASVHACWLPAPTSARLTARKSEREDA